jgi:L-amino acid N-acyltransferase YncA
MLTRQATLADAAQIAEIYNYYILNTVVTFETEAVSAQEMEGRMASILEKHDWWLLETDDKKLAGYAYYGPFRGRVAYNHTVEATIYLHPNHIGKGLGKPLYNTVIQAAAAKKYKEIIGGIALPNPQSEKLHNQLGFEKVGHFKKVGLKFGQTIDVGFWQKSL